ncbi:MAG: LPP20 family lipoprotein [Bacteroidia bacterium]|nr:LPP20 family lipoprotein [Bacteroidia bacterium]
MNKILLKYFTLLILIANTLAAQTPVEVKVPNWVSSRPQSGFKYIGIGVADKSRSSNYQMDAKKNALYDLASEIKVDISTNSVLHSVSTNNTYDQNFNSMIKLTNSDNIEGYTLVDTYENDKQYWAYYELDKDEYAKRKAQKKQIVIDKASNLISASFADETNKNFSASLKKRIQAFGILNPYLSEEINFDSGKTNGVKNIIDLTNLIQGQLQSISVVQPSVIPVVKPYQPTYGVVPFKLVIKNTVALNDFPLKLESDDEYLKIEEQTVTNAAGEMNLKINNVDPQFLLSSVTLNPDIERLTANDSVSRGSISILKQFIQTPSLKVQVNIEPISLFISSKENNFNQALQSNMLEQFVAQKFSGAEIKIVDNVANADYVIELNSNTSTDISSSVLQKTYQVNLAELSINLSLKNKKNEVVYKSTVNEIYGYANSLDKAGLNAYSNPGLKTKMSESLFFLKRKMINY